MASPTPVIAKTYAGSQTAADSSSAVTTFGPAGTPSSVGAEVAPGSPVKLEIVLPASGSSTCSAATAITIYPGDVATDPGLSTALPSTVNAAVLLLHCRTSFPQRTRQGSAKLC
jgi:hypothetical protein